MTYTDNNSETQIPFSFVLGGNNAEAINSLNWIKDSMADIMLQRHYDDMSSSDETIDCVELLFHEAQDHINRLQVA